MSSIKTPAANNRMLNVKIVMYNDEFISNFLKERPVYLMETARPHSIHKSDSNIEFLFKMGLGPFVCFLRPATPMLTLVEAESV